MDKKYEHIISLGKLCLPRMIVDHFKMREKFPVRMPFDGSYHEYHFMCEMIADDFKNYLEGSALITTSGGKGMWSKKRAYWNHEKTENFLDLQKNCEQRITQFKSVLSEARSIMFLLWDEDKEHNTKAEKIVEILKHKWPKLEFHVTHYNSFLPGNFKIQGSNYTYINKFFPKEKGPANPNILKKEHAEHLREFMVEFCQILEEDVEKYVK